MARLSHALSVNMNAFLDMIAFAEGTLQPEGNDDGYNVLVGGTLFDGYSNHPHRYVELPKMGITSSAAGRYQILGWIADFYIARMKLNDFSPESQDRIAIKLIRECHAESLIDAGEICRAITACSSRWASLPGNDYGQRTMAIPKLIKAFADAGGKLCPTSTVL